MRLMTRTQWILAAVAVSLGLLLLITRSGSHRIQGESAVPAGGPVAAAPAAPKTLNIAGYASAAQLDAERQSGILDGPLRVKHPIDRLVISRGGEEIVLRRQGGEPLAPWVLGKPADAQAVRYMAEAVAERFKTATRSIFATRVKGREALAQYGLDPTQRIGLRVEAEGQLYHGLDLWIGRAEANTEAGAEAGGAEADTWVMLKGHPELVYRVGNKDLREVVDRPLEDFRDKAVFAARPQDISRIQVRAPDGRVMVLARLAPAPDGDGDADAAAPQWRFEAPEGVAADATAKTLAKSVSAVRVERFLDRAEAVKAQRAVDNFADPTQRWSLQFVAGGRSFALTSANVTDMAQPVIARLERGAEQGGPEWLELAGFSAQNIQKTVEDFTDKRVVGKLKAAELLHAVIPDGAGGEVVLSRPPAGPLRFIKPPIDWPVDVGEIDSVLHRMRALRWARPEEIAAAIASATGPGSFEAVYTTAARRVSVRIGPPATEAAVRGQRWGLRDGRAFVIDAHNGKRIAMDLSRLKRKAVLDEDAVVTKLTVRPSQGRGFTLIPHQNDGANWLLDAADQGESPADALLRTVAATFKALKARAFPLTDKADIGTVVSRLHGTLASGETMTITVGTNNPRTDGEDVPIRIKGGPLDGKTILINPYQAKNITKTRAELME